jgi:type III secretion protein T
MFDYWHLINGTYSLWPLLLIFGRIIGAMVICPLFSSAFLSTFLRNSLALLLAALIYPVYALNTSDLTIVKGCLLLFSNVCYGALIGYFLALPIWLIESCGSLIDLERGEQLGAVINQITGTPSSSVGKLLARAFITYLVINNGLLFFLDTLYNSFTVVAPYQWLPNIDLTQWGKYLNSISAYVFWVAILVLPLLVLMLLIDFILGLISSFIPQLNVTIIAMPLKSIAVLLILSIYIGYMFHNVFAHYIVQIRQLF